MDPETGFGNYISLIKYKFSYRVNVFSQKYIALQEGINWNMYGKWMIHTDLRAAKTEPSNQLKQKLDMGS